jgi:L-histidine N-alpha-methyltransferase
MNRELGADLDLAALRHSASYNAAWQRIEIFAEFERDQTVQVRPLERALRIRAGERVMTEVSRKFVVSELEEYLAAFGLETRRVFTDPRQWYAVFLLERVPDA